MVPGPETQGQSAPENGHIEQQDEGGHYIVASHLKPGYYSHFRTTMQQDKLSTEKENSDYLLLIV